jgi:hypothetical protein
VNIHDFPDKTQEVKGEVMIDMNKQYRTRDGREARVLMTDAGGSAPVVGVVNVGGGCWETCRWLANGRYYPRELADIDLIEIKPKHVRWLNCYADGRMTWIGRGHESRESAELNVARDRIACIRVEFEEGEGLT